METFLEELHELMPHQLVVTPGWTDGRGAFVVSGQDIVIDHVQIEGEERLVRDPGGREVVSSHVVYTGEYVGLTVNRHRYTLPAEFGPPRTMLEAIRVDPASDEDGTLYEIVRLP